MTELNQQEQDVVDLLTIHKVMTAGHLSQELRWSTAKLHPIMAKLREKGVVGFETEKNYPHITIYYLENPK